MSEEPKACPYCGVQSKREGKKFHECNNSQCSNYHRLMPIDEWQTRPIEDALRSEIQNLKEMLWQCRGAISDSKSVMDKALV